MFSIQLLGYNSNRKQSLSMGDVSQGVAGQDDDLAVSVDNCLPQLLRTDFFGNKVSDMRSHPEDQDNSLDV